MKYYFFMLDDKAIHALKRVDLEADPIVLERWDTESRKWIFSPETISITGLGSDADLYKEITLQEAESFMKKKPGD